MASPTPPPDRRRLLVLSGSFANDPQLLDALREIGAVRVAESTDEAIEALRSQACDLMVCPATQIIPLARSAGHLRTENFLEEIGQGACVVDRDGKLVWANAKLESYPPHIVEAIRKACAELCQQFAEERASTRSQPHSAAKSRG